MLDLDFPFFNSDLSSICLKSKQSCHDLSEIAFFCQRQSDDVLNVYAMNMDDFFSHGVTSPRLCLINSWCGMRQPLKSIHRHPYFELAALQDIDYDISIFDSSPSRTGLRSTSGLSIITAIPRDVQANELVWIPSRKNFLNLGSEKLLLTVSNEYLSLYDVKTISKLVGSFKLNIQLKNISAYRWNCTEDCESFILIGLNIEGDMQFWTLKRIEHRYIFQMYGEKRLGESIHFFCTYSHHFGDATILPYPSLIGTLDADGIISLWHFQDPLSGSIVDFDGEQIKSFVSFKMNNFGQFSFMKFASFGKFAAVFQENTTPYIEIWDNEFSGLEMSIEWVLKLK
jgi:hypothetical protein